MGFEDVESRPDWAGFLRSVKHLSNVPGRTEWNASDGRLTAATSSAPDCCSASDRADAIWLAVAQGTKRKPAVQWVQKPWLQQQVEPSMGWE